jgi:hypothetical protein
MENRKLLLIQRNPLRERHNPEKVATRTNGDINAAATIGTTGGCLFKFGFLRWNWNCLSRCCPLRRRSRFCVLVLASGDATLKGGRDSGCSIQFEVDGSFVGAFESGDAELKTWDDVGCYTSFAVCAVGHGPG